MKRVDEGLLEAFVGRIDLHRIERVWVPGIRVQQSAVSNLLDQESTTHQSRNDGSCSSNSEDNQTGLADIIV